MAFNNRRLFKYDDQISYNEIKENLKENNYSEKKD